MALKDNWLGKRIKFAMKSAGLSSAQLAYKIGVKDGSVRGWTTGQHGIAQNHVR